MNVGLVSVDSLIPNLALMKLSAWHKAQGDSVEIAAPLWGDYDRVYRSKVFDFSPNDFAPWGCEVIDGGTGYTLDSHLPEGAENSYPDYDLFGCTYALGRITRGCVRRCPWCVVWRQDGKVRQVDTLDGFLREQTHVRLLDDNLTAMPELFVDTCEELSKRRVLTKFEALDVRLMSVDMARALAKVRRWGQVHFAWDAMNQEMAVRKGIDALKAGGFPLYAATFYVLIGFDTTPEQDAYRVDALNDLGVESFVMPFDKADPYQRKFARMTNRKEIFRTTHPRAKVAS